MSIPGDPVAQGRGRAVRVGKGVRIFDPRKSRLWKTRARWLMKQACPRPLDGPLHLSVSAYFQCPRSDERKREPMPLRWHHRRPDLDNVVKAVCDAGDQTLWGQDAQISSIAAFKFIAPQGEPPRVDIRVAQLGDEKLR